MPIDAVTGRERYRATYSTRNASFMSCSFMPARTPFTLRHTDLWPLQSLVIFTYHNSAFTPSYSTKVSNTAETFRQYFFSVLRLPKLPVLAHFNSIGLVIWAFA